MVRTARILDWSDEDWNFAFLCAVLPADFYAEMVDGLGTIEWREVSTSFYTQREANLATNDYYRTVLSPYRLAGIRALAEDFFGCEVERKIEVAAHRLVCGDQIGIHTDRNSLGESHRLTIHLNRDWSQEQGGVLVALRGRDFSTATHAWLPRANTGFLFEIGSRSFHAVTSVQGIAPRYSIVFTFRAKRPGPAAEVPRKRWLPFPVISDLESASAECERLGIGAKALESDFQYATRDEILGLAADQPSRSAEYSPSAEGSLAPIVAVQKNDGRLVVVEGARRLAHAGDTPDQLRVVVFRQPKARVGAY